jgi:hypothetical protein
VPIIEEAVWAPGPVWIKTENLAEHRDSIPGPSIRYKIAIIFTLSQSEVRVSYISTKGVTRIFVT